ncbi:SulP family inorganic anion transporter [Methylotuvimicrobium alcaliphilum]|uniref:Anion transporter n=1 Tax=Methylotuvimicrobium alcaliphilum (strain DSM 19304 / NCIMB 14124 / VKM B-2133 / 20Z) TaxID=1091494 RepID=G4SUL8_META2|nr:SulP family inorganic anion transporter [Methylotuvimicrobium alcaliphilum]CCE22845.1 putative anion transporter [Methylotuvimicrobium alcaliphilum 20Z]
MKNYSFAMLKGDIFGGLTAGVVALPLALAFGVASGAGALAGLYGAIALGLVAAVFGGTQLQVSGPTGPMTVVFASALTTFGGSFQLALAVVLVGGLLQILFGLLRLGGLVRFIPYPVISGFMSGVGMIIIILQMAPFLGSAPDSSTLSALFNLPSVIESVRFDSMFLGSLTLAIVFLTPIKISRFIPSPLLALFIGTQLAVFASLETAVIGDIPAGLPDLHFPSFSLEHWSSVFMLGLTLALLGSIDSLLTSLVTDSITHTHHKPNRELIAQGLGNILCAFIGGLPGAGATMRTVVNVKAGGQTRLSSVIHALFLLLLLLELSPLASQIPLPVLAGVLIKVGFNIIDYRMFKLASSSTRSELMIMFCVLLLTVLVDLVIGVTVGVILAMGMLTWRLAQQADISFETNHDYHLTEKPGRGVRIMSIKGPLFFGSTSHMLDRIEAVDSIMDTEEVLLDCRRVDLMDLSAIVMLDEVVQYLQGRSMLVRVLVKPALREQLLSAKSSSFNERILFTSLHDALVPDAQLQNLHELDSMGIMQEDY